MRPKRARHNGDGNLGNVCTHYVLLHLIPRTPRRPGNSRISSRRASLILSYPTAGAFCVPAPAERVQSPQVRTKWYHYLLFLPRNAFTSPFVLRCGRDLRPNVGTRTRPGKVHQSPPGNPRRHPRMVALHEADFADDPFCGVSPAMRYAAKRESYTGNLCGDG